jgi:hypothetical protein
VKSAAYTSMVRPTMEYASSVWDPTNRKKIGNLEKVQKRAARFVFNNYTDRTPGCVTKMDPFLILYSMHSLLDFSFLLIVPTSRILPF